ncbi:MAG: hypothetical protein ACRD3B_05750, partial [Candidatus Sulfotelmatobacter sp.]
LAWSGDVLHASRGYQLLRAKIDGASPISWQPVAALDPGWKRKLSAANPLTARLFRDGFHALVILPSGGLVAAVPGAIVALRPGESEFRRTHSITRGTRPLHIIAVPGGSIYWGEYFDNAARDQVHIYASSDGGGRWNVAYTFPKGSIRHVHNIVHDPWANCLWVLTGDYGDECRILRFACDFSAVETVLQSKQQARAVAAVSTENGLVFSTDTPLEQNFIYRLDRNGNLSQLAAISNSSINGCRVGDRLFFSTMVEPSEVNRDRSVRVYGSDVNGADPGQPLLAWQKDRWPMRLFQYGNAFLPDGDNSTNVLAITTIAVQSDDQVTSLYSVNS